METDANTETNAQGADMAASGEIFRDIQITDVGDHCDDEDLVYIPAVSDDEADVDIGGLMASQLPPSSPYTTPNFDDEFSSQEGIADYFKNGDLMNVTNEEVVEYPPTEPECDRSTIETCIVSDMGDSMGQNRFEVPFDQGSETDESDSTIEYDFKMPEDEVMPQAEEPEQADKPEEVQNRTFESAIISSVDTDTEVIAPTPKKVAAAPKVVEPAKEVPKITPEEVDIVLGVASKILGETEEKKASKEVQDLVSEIEKVLETPEAIAVAETLTSTAVKISEEPSTSTAGQSKPSVSQISNDHDYLWRKLSHLQRVQNRDNTETRQRVEQVKRFCDEYLTSENPSAINEMAQTFDELLCAQEIVLDAVDDTFYSRRVSSEDSSGELVTTIVKEEYQMIELPQNEPPEIHDEEDFKVQPSPPSPLQPEIEDEFIDDDMSELDLSKAFTAALLKDFGQRIVHEADVLTLKNEKELSKFFIDIRAELRKVELEFGVCPAKADAESQVSRKEFLKLNEAAKQQLLDGASSSEDEAATVDENVKPIQESTPMSLPATLEEPVEIANEPVLDSSRPERPESVDYDVSDTDMPRTQEETQLTNAKNGQAEAEEEEEPQRYENLLEPDIAIEEDSNELTYGDNEKDDDEDSDGEIDRLIDLSGLEKRRETRDDYTKYTKPKKLKPNEETDAIEQLMNGINGHSESTDEESEGEMTEEQFLNKQNEFIKMQLLEESSESELEDDLMSVESEAQDSSELEEADSDGSLDLVDRFFAKMNEEQERAEASEEEEEDEEVQVKTKTPKRKISLDSLTGSSRKKRRDSGTESDASEVLDLSMFQETQDRIREMDNSTTPIATEIAPEVMQPIEAVAEKVAEDDDDDHISLSSDSDSDSKASDVPTQSRHRKIISDDQLAKTTKEAEKEEEDRIKRLNAKVDTVTQMTQNDPNLADQMVLDMDLETKKPVVVNKMIADKLKKHQKEGVRFMYNCCYGDINKIDKHPGSGCILAHCMGLGKTLQLIALLHTLIQYPKLKTHKVLVICPKSTVLNWSDEFNRWLRGIKGGPRLKVHCFDDSDSLDQKVVKLESWHKSDRHVSGCFLVGYEAFRTLVNFEGSKKRQTMRDEVGDRLYKRIEKCLLSPGADLVVCDEGHMIKNQKSAITAAVAKIKTKRRIILTGTPIQNNLNEYYCMVNFIKPSFLGTEKEFNNRYATPIKAGEHADSTPQDIKQMQRRAFVLHRKLLPFVQRKEASILKEFLPEKYEYVLSIPLTQCQERVYGMFVERFATEGISSGKTLLPDYTFLRKIWTHPRVLEMAFQEAKRSKQRKDTKNLDKILKRLEKDKDDDDHDDGVYDIGTESNSVLDDWWRKHIRPEDFNSIIPSCKLQAMLQILKICRERKEKCLIFTGYVAVLNVVEYFFNRITEQADNPRAREEGLTSYQNQPWVRDKHYFRLDGSTPKTLRHRLITEFNNPANESVVCFLISARAGGQGINLIGANRVVILDTSWNPSNDQQNIFRIYRLGQKRPCFVYRLLAMGTMEEKVYSRSVTKQAMSFRVVDEQQIDRHYNGNELSELYKLTPTDLSQRPIPHVPKDALLAQILNKFPNLVFKYHEHDSLLENKPEQHLTEEEKRDAWLTFQREEEMEKARENANNMPRLPDNMLGINPNYFANYSAANPYGMYPTSSQLASPFLGQMNNFMMQQTMEQLYRSQYISQAAAAMSWMPPQSSQSRMGPPIIPPPDFTAASMLQGNPVMLDPKQKQTAGISSELSPIMNSVAKLSGSSNHHASRSSPSASMSISRTSPQVQVNQNLGQTRISPSQISPAHSGGAPQAGPSRPSRPTQMDTNNGAHRPRGRPKKPSFEHEFQQKFGVGRDSPTIIEIPDDPSVRIEPFMSSNPPQKVTNIGIFNPKTPSTGISIDLPDNITVNKIAKMPATTVPTTMNQQRPLPTSRPGSSVSIRTVRPQAPQIPAMRPNIPTTMHRPNLPSQVRSNSRIQQSRPTAPPPMRPLHPNRPGSSMVITQRPSSRPPPPPPPSQQPQIRPSVQSSRQPSFNQSQQGITLTQLRNKPSTGLKLNIPKQIQNSVTVTPIHAQTTHSRTSAPPANVQIRQMPMAGSHQSRSREPPIQTQSIFSTGPPSKLPKKKIR